MIRQINFVALIIRLLEICDYEILYLSIIFLGYVGVTYTIYFVIAWYELLNICGHVSDWVINGSVCLALFVEYSNTSQVLSLWIDPR